MEDQPADSGDLTASAVPEGKSARRHRLPRQKLRETDAPKDDATHAQSESESESGDVASADDVTPADEVAAAPESSEEPSVSEAATAEPSASEPVASEEPVEPEPVASEPEAVASEPTRRRRFPWGRTKAAAPVAVTEPVAPSAPAEAETEAETDSAATEPEAEPVVDEPVEPVESQPEVAAEATPEPVAETDVHPTADADADPDVPADDAAAEPEPEPVLVPHRTAGRGLKVAAVTAGALFVGAAAFAGATLQPYLADRAEVHTKYEVAEISADAITTLWTYTPDDMDTLPDRAAKYLGGDFAAEYKRYIDSIVEPNKQAQVSNATQVLGSAVETLTPTEATALVYTNSVATSPVTKGIPSLRYLSYRLSLERRDNDWLITRMTAVTSLDLTPRL